MLFYNCLSTERNKKFKVLIKGYAILKNLRFSLLAAEEDKALYEDGAYEHKKRQKNTKAQEYLASISQ